MVSPSMKRDASHGKDAKRKAGVEAASLVQSGMVVGLGTGSTTAFAIEELGRRIKDEGLEINGIPTSFSAEILAQKNGIPLQRLADVAGIDLAIDGADEVDAGRNLIKGGGAAHTMEKVIDCCATRFVVVADDSKVVPTLGQGFAVPVEVLPFAWTVVRRQLEQLGANPELRFGAGKDGPVITDLGHFVLDAKFEGIDDPPLLDRELSGIPGVVEHGLFVGVVEQVIVGQSDGSLSKF